MPTPCKFRRTNTRCTLKAHGRWCVWQRHPMNMFEWDEIKAKTLGSNFIFTALPLIGTTFIIFCVLYCNPKANLPTWYNTKPSFSGNFHIQHHGSFRHKARDQTPLNLGKKGRKEGGEERFKSWTNDIQKLWTCWCAGSGLRLNWITRRHPLRTALMSGEEGRCRGEGEGGRRRGENHYVQVGGGGWVLPSNAAAEAFTIWLGRIEKDNKGMWTEGLKPGVERWVVNKGGRRGQKERINTVFKVKGKEQSTAGRKYTCSLFFYLLWATVEIWHFVHSLYVVVIKFTTVPQLS